MALTETIPIIPIITIYEYIKYTQIPCRYMIFCGPREGRHTGALVAKKLEVIDSTEIRKHCFKAMTTDNATNMQVASRESSSIVQGLTCFAHTLNLTVNRIKKFEKV
jgi:vacuolar-type H+-ATPase catalytic subunit A/Vma1